MKASKLHKTYRVPLLYDGAGGSLLPPELQACEYLMTDGNSYIQTDLDVINLLTIEAKVTINNTNSQILKAYQSNSQQFSLYVDNNDVYGARPFRSANLSSTSVRKGTNCIFQYNKTTKKIYFNEVEKTNSQTQYDTSANLELFAESNNGDIMYYINTNFCNLIACYVMTDKTYKDNKNNTCIAGTPGFVNTVTGIFYTNDGTGNFTAGPDINL